MPETTTINLEPNAAYVLDLPGLGICGYSWVYDLKPANLVKISHQYIVPPNPKPGERGIERFTLTAVQRGACVLELKQIHSWEKDQPPLDQRTIQVKVK